jgi:tRNA-splicing ligase RtcB
MNRVIDTERIPIKLWVSNDENKWFYAAKGQQSAFDQAKNLANLPFAEKWIAIMPDSHVGYGMPIGGVMATNQVIVPNAVGVDIGCGMVAVKTSIEEITEAELIMITNDIRKVIPTGFNHQDEPQDWAGFDRAPDLEVIQRELGKARNQLGTLGGGNHFIELQKSDQGYVWLMIHSGSRNFGKQTADFYHKAAKILCERWESDIPHKDLSFLPMDSLIGQDYFEAMKYAMDFAEANRALMMANAKRVVSEIMGFDTHFVEVANIHHNFAAMEHHYGKNVLVHRKGATKATSSTIGIIPGSMGTNSYIVRGLGNPESFESCSHGAGRTMGRGQAKRDLSLEEERAKMEGIVSRMDAVGKLDEAPGSYKDIDEVMANQRDLVEIQTTLTPIANIKG